MVSVPACCDCHVQGLDLQHQPGHVLVMVQAVISFSMAGAVRDLLLGAQHQWPVPTRVAGGHYAPSKRAALACVWGRHQ